MPWNAWDILYRGPALSGCSSHDSGAPGFLFPNTNVVVLMEGSQGKTRKMASPFQIAIVPQAETSKDIPAIVINADNVSLAASMSTLTPPTELRGCAAFLVQGDSDLKVSPARPNFSSLLSNPLRTPLPALFAISVPHSRAYVEISIHASDRQWCLCFHPCSLATTSLQTAHRRAEMFLGRTA